MKLGLIDIDTSHPAAWMPLLRRMGHDVTALFDGGAVLSAAQAREFAAAHGIAVVCARLEEMIPLVDGVIIHSCNWDSHVARARPFVAAGKAVLLDKPLAGSVRDLRQIVAWARAGCRITGGSCMRFAPEAMRFLAEPESARGRPRLTLAGCGTDEYNYGIHAYAMLWSVMGAGARAVRWLAERPQWLTEITWDDDRRGLAAVGGDVGWLPTYATMITNRGVRHLTSSDKAEALYQPLLDAVLPYLSGATAMPPLPMEELIEPELAALATLESRRRGGAVVALETLNETMPGYDGAAFARRYASDRRGVAPR